MLDNQQSKPTSTAINADIIKDSNSTPVTYQQIQSITVSYTHLTLPTKA